MKRYSDFYDEINPDEIYEGLLGYGLFSEKLPPVFSSEDFYNYCVLSSPAFKDNWHPYVYYESMRNTNVPRQFGIPHPMAYQLLCKCISDNWSQIQLHIRQKTQNQKYNVSRIHIRRIANSNALFKMNYEAWKTDGTPEPDLLISSKYIVHADISTCFPSIYTHSIPWALVGKDFAKAHAGRKWKNKWYNQIDHLTQICKNGETHGLLIGPHASNLLSEIILTCVDCELSTKWKYTRNIDDYTCFAESREQAQLFIVELTSALREYDLSLNHKKTEIIELPKAITEQWVRQIANPEMFFKNGRMDFIGVRSYLDNAIETMQANKENSAVLNYAIKTIPADKLTKNASDFFVKTVFYLSLLYPYLLQIMDKYVFERFNVSISEISSFSDTAYIQELKNKNYDGVCYALFFAIKYGIQINSVNAQDAIDSDSCLFRLFSYIYFRKNAMQTEADILYNFALSLKMNDFDFDQNWIFLYEVLQQNDLPPEWDTLKANNVSFLKAEYQV